MTSGPAGPHDRLREPFALERDVLVPSVAMFAFSPGLQTTSRYSGECPVALGGRTPDPRPRTRHERRSMLESPDTSP